MLFSFRVGRRRWAFWPEALPELFTIMKDPRDPQRRQEADKERERKILLKISYTHKHGGEKSSHSRRVW